VTEGGAVPRRGAAPPPLAETEAIRSPDHRVFYSSKPARPGSWLS